MPAILLPPHTLSPRHSPSRIRAEKFSTEAASSPSTGTCIIKTKSEYMVPFDEKIPVYEESARKDVTPTAEFPGRELPSLLGPVSSFLYQHAFQTRHEDSPNPPSPAALAELDEDLKRSEQHCPSRQTDDYHPPPNFGTVMDGKVFRSSYPKAENYSFLKRLGVKTILTLVEGPAEVEYRDFMAREGIQHVEVHILPNKGAVCVEAAQVTKALEIVMDASNFPLLIHCNKGKHRTGCVVGAFRKCQGWSMEEIIGEYHIYADVKARLWDEVFLRFFNQRHAISLITHKQSHLDGNATETRQVEPQHTSAINVGSVITDIEKASGREPPWPTVTTLT